MHLHKAELIGHNKKHQEIKAEEFLRLTPEEQQHYERQTKRKTKRQAEDPVVQQQTAAKAKAWQMILNQAAQEQISRNPKLSKAEAIAHVSKLLVNPFE